MKNVFSGNTLEQNLVTYDENGIPRKSIREITDYMFPMDADTLYRDARGLWASKHPSIIDELFNKTHSDKYIKTVDENLEGFEPIQFNEKEVKATQKKSKKEMGGKIQKGQNGLYDLGFSFKPIGFRNNFSVPRLTLSNDALGLSSISAQDMVKKANALRRDAEIAKTIDLNNKIDNHLRKIEGLKNIKPWYDQSSFIGPVTNPVDVLNAGPQELMSDEEMNSRRASAKKIDDFIKSVKPMSIEPDINTQIANAKNFSQAFGLARKAGLKEFDWKGKRIPVKLRSDSPETTTPAVETPVTTQSTQPVVQPTQPTITPAPKKSTEDLWRDILHTGGAGLYPYQAPVTNVESDAYLGPTGQWSRPQTGYVYTPVTIEDRIAATGVDPNSPQGRRMAKYINK